MYRAGRRNAGVRLRRARPTVENRRHRFSRRISPRPPGKFDRVRFLVTAGPTREPLDPVRYLSNRSSGKMGYAIAAAALAEQHDVTLISGPVALAPPPGAQLVSVTTGEEMFAAASAQFSLCDVFVMCAAICDY